MERGFLVIKREKVLKKIFESAQAYRKNLQDKNILFIFKKAHKVCWIEALFLARNFKHLTGVDSNIRANAFYSRALDKRLGTEDLGVLQGTTELKLDVLPVLIETLSGKTRKALMIGEKAQVSGYYFHTEKMIGSVSRAVGCMGFVQEKSSFYVPNTVLKADIREKTSESVPVEALYIKRRRDPLYEILFARKTYDVSHIPEALRKKISFLRP